MKCTGELEQLYNNDVVDTRIYMYTCVYILPWLWQYTPSQWSPVLSVCETEQLSLQFWLSLALLMPGGPTWWSRGEQGFRWGCVCVCMCVHVCVCVYVCADRVELVGQVVKALDCQPWGGRFKSPPAPTSPPSCNGWGASSPDSFSCISYGPGGTSGAHTICWEEESGLLRVPSPAPGVCSALAHETCLVHRPLALPGARGRLAAAIEFAFSHLCVCVCMCMCVCVCVHAVLGLHVYTYEWAWDTFPQSVAPDAPLSESSPQSSSTIEHVLDTH